MTWSNGDKRKRRQEYARKCVQIKYGGGLGRNGLAAFSFDFSKQMAVGRSALPYPAAFPKQAVRLYTPAGLRRR